MDLSSNVSGNIEESELYQSQIHLYKQMHSIVSTMVLKSAVELGIADAIHNHGKPMTLPQLASTLKLHPVKFDILYRLMRMLTHNGVFTKTTVKAEAGEEETVYGLTPSSKLLVRSEPLCIASFASGLPGSNEMWNFTKKWFTDDKDISLYETATGETFWDMLNKDSESDTLSFFQQAMAADSQMFKLALRDCKHVFEGLESLVDVGGGTGTVAKLIQEVFPDIKLTVLDQPQVVGNLTGNKNLNFVGGDMFNFIPHADAVLIKWVLHDWSDELSLKILKNSKEAISGKGKNGKVIIIDIAIDETSANRDLTGLHLNYDMLMLTLYNGKEREKKEWEKLIYNAGFSSYKITPIWGFKSLIEVYP